MAKEPIYLTAKGLEKFKEELKYLKEVRRDQLSEYMGSAIADGDLRESAAYDEARLLQSANETRIADLEEIVHRASVVEGQEGENVAARLGSSLLMEDTSGKRETFYLVGTHEANFFENRISDESPLGKEFIGKRAGDKVKFKTIEYNVVDQ
jgi:transcription elongation factor GreA